MSIEKVIENIDRRFFSHNEVEVERATIKKHEWTRVKEHIGMLLDDVANLEHQLDLSEIVE